MQNREELKKEIMELGWHALPYFERLAYRHELGSRIKLQLKRRLHAEKWQCLHMRIVMVLLAMAATTCFVNPKLDWQLGSFFGISAMVIFGMELFLRPRTTRIKKALRLKKQLKSVQ